MKRRLWLKGALAAAALLCGAPRGWEIKEEAAPSTLNEETLAELNALAQKYFTNVWADQVPTDTFLSLPDRQGTR